MARIDHLLAVDSDRRVINIHIEMDGRIVGPSSADAVAEGEMQGNGPVMQILKPLDLVLPRFWTGVRVDAKHALRAPPAILVPVEDVGNPVAVFPRRRCRAIILNRDDGIPGLQIDLRGDPLRHEGVDDEPAIVRLPGDVAVDRTREPASGPSSGSSLAQRVCLNEFGMKSHRQVCTARGGDPAGLPEQEFPEHMS